MPRRRKSIWDIFDEIDDMFEELREMMEKSMSEFLESSRWSGPYVYGFSITIGPDGKPVIREFGNVRRERGRPRITEEREPLIDVIEDEKHITVVAELPGVEKENINVKATEDTLIVSAKGIDKKYYKEIPLPAKVIPESAKASYKNGVLEVRLERKKSKSEGIDVKVE